MSFVVCFPGVVRDEFLDVADLAIDDRARAPAPLRAILKDSFRPESGVRLRVENQTVSTLYLRDMRWLSVDVKQEASQRGFHKQAQYREGRQVRNSRKARAMAKGSRYGRQEQEEVWQNTEVDALYRLAAAGVRVPQPYHFVDGVLLMQLITDAEGDAAPRLDEVDLTLDQARAYHASLISDVVKMLCIGLVHGDLSEFNVLLDSQGPVIIDLPQAVDAAANNHAPWMLARDVNTLAGYFGQFAPELLTTSYAEEIWHLYEHSHLTPNVTLTGHFKGQHQTVDLDAILNEIHEAEVEATRGKLALEGIGSPQHSADIE